jgi:hypothetical protein
MTMQLCFYGNAYALVERNSVGDVISLIPLMSANMDVRLEGKKIVYRYQRDHEYANFSQREIFHLKGLVLMAWWGCLRLPMRANLRVLRSQWRISSVSFTLTARSLQAFNHGRKVLTKEQRGQVEENFKEIAGGPVKNASGYWKPIFRHTTSA